MGDQRDGYSDYYKEVVIADTPCIEWTFPSLPDDKSKIDKERARRRKIKDLVGADHLDTPMLDSKIGLNGKEYCDIIILTEYLSEWESTMMDHYESRSYRFEKKTHRVTGFQINWFDSDVPVVSVNLYPNKGKFMIQPGAKNADRLTEWIFYCAKFKNTFHQSHGDDETHVKCAEMNRQEDMLADETPTVPDDQTVMENTRAPLTPSAPPSNAVNDIPRPCNEVCRQMACDLQYLMTTVESLTDTVDKLSNKVTRNNDTQVDNLTLINDKLERENATLRNSVAELTQKLNSATWRSFRTSTHKNNLLIGSSIIREVDAGKLLDTEVVCKPGGTINTLKHQMDELNNGYKNITLVVGGNDCDSTPTSDPATIVTNYQALIDSAKSKSDHVVVSSICPRLTSQRTQDRIDAVNAGLLSSCADNESVTFVDNTPSFQLGDGSVNDGYLLADGVDITRPAMNKLAKNLRLPITNADEGVCSKFIKQVDVRKTRDVARSQPAARRAHEMNTDEEGWTTARRHRRSDNTSHDRCRYCAEKGHSASACRHGRPVECYSCHNHGHKSKFCTNVTR